MPTSSPAIADLRARWHILTDLDRASALLPIIESGISRRDLAHDLNCSESLIRHLLQAVAAPPEDQELARRGAISTNELVRRTRTNSEPTTVQQQNRPSLCMEDGVRLILDWLHADVARKRNARWILKEVLHRLKLAESCGELPIAHLRADVDSHRVSVACRPNKDRDELDVSWYARWLLRYVVAFMADPN